MNIRSESEIVLRWVEGGRPVVSVVCATYNHEDFIEEAIKGFLLQETDFPFEIVIHDDASVDATARIVTKYAELYPRIIKPVLQKVNMMSQGFKPTINCLPYVRGDYIALCEGDDFWVDANKLSMQVNALEANKGVDICFHSAYRQVQFDAEERELLAGPINNDGVVGICRVVAGDGDFMQTGSLMFRKKVIEGLPAWFGKDAPVGDYFIQIYGAKDGGAYFINKPMSVYRVGAISSWTSSMRDANKRIGFELRFVECLKRSRSEFGVCGSAFSIMLVKHAGILAELGRRVSNSVVVEESRKLYGLYGKEVTIKQKMGYFESLFGLRKLTYLPRKMLSLIKKMVS